MKKVIYFFSLGAFCFLAPLVFAQLPDPVGHWPFDEGSGSVAADVSGNGNDGAIWSEGVFWSDDTPSGTGHSLEFAGKLGAVQIGDPDILKIVGDITLAAWVKTGPATENWQNIVVKGHGQAAGEIVLRVDGQTDKHEGTQIWCGSYDGADHMVQSYTLVDQEFNTWIHVVGVYSAAYQTWYLYFNGDEVAELVDIVGAVSVDRGWAIGARALAADGTYPSERYFEGLIDDVRIYNVALTEDDVKALYQESITPTAVKNQSAIEPTNFALGQNYPNPFNPQTQIDYQVPKAANVNISVYSIIGQVVTTLVDEVKNPGYYSVSWNARDQNGLRVSSGIYIARMVSNNYSATRKLILLK
jgi:hypothetical protein